MTFKGDRLKAAKRDEGLGARGFLLSPFVLLFLVETFFETTSRVIMLWRFMRLSLHTKIGESMRQDEAATHPSAATDGREHALA